MSKLWRTLVVDDSETNRQLIKEFIHGKAECEEAEDGLKAWKLYNKTMHGEAAPYDIVLLDIAMPRMDGVKLLTLIREFENFEKKEKLPILVITAHKEKVDDAVSAGCDDYLLKPVSSDDLLAKMTTLIK